MAGAFGGVWLLLSVVNHLPVILILLVMALGLLPGLWLYAWEEKRSGAGAVSP